MTEPKRHDVDITIQLNGRRRAFTVETHTLLAELLRERCGLNGCRIACDAGVCGACTVLADGHPVAACSTFAFDVDGTEVTTIEALSVDGTLHPLQRAFIERDAFQCGFCTSGTILAIKAMLVDVPCPDEGAIRSALGGNLCRCTGYQMIVEAVAAAAAAMDRGTV